MILGHTLKKFIKKKREGIMIEPILLFNARPIERERSTRHQQMWSKIARVKNEKEKEKEKWYVYSSDHTRPCRPDSHLRSRSLNLRKRKVGKASSSHQNRFPHVLKYTPKQSRAEPLSLSSIN